MTMRSSLPTTADPTEERAPARRIRVDGAADVFTCEAGDTIARAALRAGLGFPYECNVGSCGTCRFVLVEGEVEHQRAAPPAWTERDLKRNRFLGCQAAPKTDCTIKLALNPDYVVEPAPRRLQARLAGWDDLNHDMRLFHFEPLEPLAFRAGQYALFDLPEVEGWRPYSMANAPGQGAGWSFLIRRVPGGAATTVLFDRLAADTVVTLDGPYGCAFLREAAPRDLLCVAGGSGLSPIVAIAAAAAASPALAERTIHVVYGGRTPADIVGETLLAGLPGFGDRITFTPAVSIAESAAGWDGRVGLVHEVARELHGERLADMEVYFAGPPAMSQAMQLMLHELKVPPGQVHFDQFF